MYNTDPETDILGRILQILECHVERGTIFPANAPCKTGGVYIFSLWNDISTANGLPLRTLNLATPTFGAVKSLARGSNEQPINWEINFWGWERRDFSAAGGGVVSPVPENELRNILNQNTFHQSILPIRISWESNAGGTYRDVDIRNGGRVNIRASEVQVSALAPLVSDNTNNNLPAHLDPLNGQTISVPTLDGGVVLSSLIGCSIKPAEATYPAGLNTLTRTVLVQPTEVLRTVRVPPGARYVSAYQHPDSGAAAQTVTFVQNNNGVLINLGQLEIPSNLKLEKQSIPSQASEILALEDPGGQDVFITFVFHLDV